MSDFQVRKPEIEVLLKELGHWLKSKMPKGWGFSLMIFNHGEKGSMFYISDSNREDMIEAMKEFIERNTH